MPSSTIELTLIRTQPSPPASAIAISLSMSSMRPARTRVGATRRREYSARGA
ncbi:Uncharacterised protein [Mycobacteroides abscessus subsp. abscessus]|nr:Uncharacterised protein [Mycobacteroides abscessus subsp. abscessus]